MSSPLGRRNFVIGAGALLAARLSSAQQPKIVRVSSSVPHRASPTYSMVTSSFLKRMAELGYKEGQNFLYQTEALPPNFGDADFMRIYRNLAARKTDVYLAIGLEAAVKGAVVAAGTAPIVMVAVNWDPLAKGYVASLGRPGRNITGVVFLEVELTTKRLQLLLEALPGLKATTVFWDDLSADQWAETQAAAARLGLRIHGVKFETPPYDFERALAAIPSEFRRSLICLGSPQFTLPERKSLPDAALRHRIPTVYAVGEYVNAGGLLSYGPNYPELFGRAADFVDRIAKGRKPADIPIEQPTRYELAVNLKTAKALGIRIPSSILVRADRVIE